MNRLFGKNTKKQQLTQHSLLDDNEEDDDVFTQVEAAFPEYCPPPASLLPEPLRKPMQSDKDVPYPSSPHQKVRGGGVGRYQSTQHISSSSPTQQQPPLSPLVTTNTVSLPRVSSPRRFSSPDRVPKFLSVVNTATATNNTKVSMIQNLRDRMKFGSSTGAPACSPVVNDTTIEPSSKHTTATGKKYLEPPSMLFSSAEFSEPFTTTQVDDANIKAVLPASEAFTVTCTMTSEEMDNDAFEDAATQQPRPKLKFSISNEPIQAKVGTAIKALNCHSTASKEEKSEETEIDMKEPGGVSSIENETIAKQRVTKAIRQGRKKTTDKRPKTPTHEPTPDIVTTPKTPTVESANKSELDNVGDNVNNANISHDKKSSSTKTPIKSSAKSTLKTPRKISPSEKETRTTVQPPKGNIEIITIDHDGTGEIITPPSFHQKSKSNTKDCAPQTPKRTYSMDDVAQFVWNADASGGVDMTDDEKKIATKNHRHITNCTHRPKTPNKSTVAALTSGDKDSEVAPSEVKTKESKKSNSKSPKTPTKESSKKKKCADEIKAPKSPSKKESSSTKPKGKDQVSHNEKQIATTDKKKKSASKKQKRRNSTNTMMTSDDNDNHNSTDSLPMIGNKWLGIIDTNEPPSTTRNGTMSKRRNSCTSIASSITMDNALVPPILESSVTLPDAFNKALDDDVPPWVKAAMHMIEQYQKNKDFIPPVDPITLLPISSSLSPPMQTPMNPMSNPGAAPKAPTRAQSFSSSSDSGSSSCSTDSSEDRFQAVASSEGNINDMKLTPAIEDEIKQESVVEVGCVDSPPPNGITQLEKKQNTIPLTKETIPPKLSRSNSSDRELMGSVGRSVDSSLRSKTPQPSLLLPIEKNCAGTKISLHSSSLYKRDITPCRGTNSRNNSGSSENELGTTSTVSGKDRFRELRRIAKKAANEPVSSDDDECGDNRGDQKSQPPTRRLGTTKASFRNNAAQTTLNTKSQPENQLMRNDATPNVNDASAEKQMNNDEALKTTDALEENASPTRRERRGSIQFRNLRRLAKLAANEPLSDDEDTILGGVVDIAKADSNGNTISHTEKEKVHRTNTVQPPPPPTAPMRSSILRSRSKTLENIPSLQQRKETLFDK